MRRRSAARRKLPSSRTTKNKRSLSSMIEIVMHIVHHCNHKPALATRLEKAQAAISKYDENEINYESRVYRGGKRNGHNRTPFDKRRSHDSRIQLQRSGNAG